jgi:hypothetical protein
MTVHAHVPLTRLGSPQPLSRWLIAAALTATLLAGTIAAIGMAASFHTVSREMTPSFGPAWAWTVLVTLDLTIGAFSLLEIVLLRLHLPHLLARAIVYAATAATIYLNTRAAVGHGYAQELAHAAMPSVWVVYIELLRGAATCLTRREQGKPEHPAFRCLLAPSRAFTEWRDAIVGRGEADGADGADCQIPALVGPEDKAQGTAPANSANCPPNWSEPREGPDVGDAAADDIRFPTGRPPPGPGRGHSQKAVVLTVAASHPAWSNADIARYLGLSPRTVRRHRHGR